MPSPPAATRNEPPVSNPDRRSSASTSAAQAAPGLADLRGAVGDLSDVDRRRLGPRMPPAKNAVGSDGGIRPDRGVPLKRHWLQ